MIASIVRPVGGSRAALRRMAVAVLMVPAVLIGSGAAATAAPGESLPVCEQSLIGTWDVHVRTSLPSSGDINLTFLPDGTIEPPPGEPVTDTWESVTCHRFTFRVVHPAVDATGEVIGEVRGDQAGVLLPERFVSQGTSIIYNLEDEPVGSFKVWLRATRQAP
jgi:hypothetical protein